MDQWISSLVRLASRPGCEFDTYRDRRITEPVLRAQVVNPDMPFD
jgi:hypothetical protein